MHTLLLSNNFSRNRVYFRHILLNVYHALFSSLLLTRVWVTQYGFSIPEPSMRARSALGLHQRYSLFLQPRFVFKIEPFRNHPAQNVTQTLQNMFFKCNESQKWFGTRTPEPKYSVLLKAQAQNQRLWRGLLLRMGMFMEQHREVIKLDFPSLISHQAKPKTWRFLKH